jgi:hypothetical protein
MSGESNVGMAKETFGRISAAFPNLTMRVHNDDDRVDLSMDIPEQPGLTFKISLNLQNNNELHLQAGHFWLEWFPCTNPTRVNQYVDAVCGLLSGRYRILEHYRGNKTVMAELQAPEGSNWKTIGTWGTLWRSLFFHKQQRVIINA